MNRPYTWTASTISDIVKKPEYMGYTVNFRTKKLSYKDKNSVQREKVEREAKEKGLSEAVG